MLKNWIHSSLHTSTSIWKHVDTSTESLVSEVRHLHYHHKIHHFGADPWSNESKGSASPYPRRQFFMFFLWVVIAKMSKTLNFEEIVQYPFWWNQHSLQPLHALTSGWKSHKLRNSKQLQNAIVIVSFCCINLFNGPPAQIALHPAHGRWCWAEVEGGMFRFSPKKPLSTTQFKKTSCLLVWQLCSIQPGKAT